MYFADMQALGTKVGDAASIAQHLLSQMASKLAGLAVACRRAPAPQLWLGASLAVTLDTGAEGHGSARGECEALWMGAGLLHNQGNASESSPF